MGCVDSKLLPKEAARKLFADLLGAGAEAEDLNEYVKADGTPIYWRARLRMSDGSKLIRPFHLNGNGYVLGEPKHNGLKPLYGLDRLAKSDPTTTVWVTEGEHKADALNRLGILAVTSGGATSATGADWKPIQGQKSAIIWPDHDQPGFDYARSVGSILTEMGMTVHIIEVAKTGVPAKGDVVDWLALNPASQAADVEKLPRKPFVLDDAPAWAEPISLTTKLASEPYPDDALPAQIRAAVREVQGFVKAPLAMVATSALTAISLATQALYDVKRTESLTGPTGLFLLVVAESGERKSTCEGQFLSEIRRWENEQAEAAKPVLKKYSADFDAWKAERDGILLAIKEASKKAKPADKLRSDLSELQNLEPQKPRVPRMLRSDATPEALSWVLAKEWPSAAIASSEGGAVLGAHGMGKDSVMRNLARFNILWDGGELSIDRRTSESFKVRGVRLTMSLQVQEAALREFFEKTGQLARGTGFLARFLVAWPESTQGTRTFVEPPVSLPALSAFHHSIRRLLELPVTIDDDGCLNPDMLTMADAAKAAWVNFYNAIESELKPGAELADVRDVASKTGDNALRLASLFHAFEGRIGPVGIEAVEFGCRIAAWHLHEARRFFGEIALSPESINAAKLDTWLIQRAADTRCNTVPTNDVLQFGPASLRNRDTLTLALRELEPLNRARERLIGKRKAIDVNPAVVASRGQ